jgi:hypothetical protein
VLTNPLKGTSCVGGSDITWRIAAQLRDVGRTIDLARHLQHIEVRGRKLDFGFRHRRDGAGRPGLGRLLVLLVLRSGRAVLLALSGDIEGGQGAALEFGALLAEIEREEGEQQQQLDREGEEEGERAPSRRRTVTLPIWGRGIPCPQIRRAIFGDTQ